MRSAPADMICACFLLLCGIRRTAPFSMLLCRQKVPLTICTARATARWHVRDRERPAYDRRKGGAFRAYPKPRRPQPTMIVLHDTAGRLTRGSAVAWLRDPKAKASAHVVV